ncbi:MAG TPA: glycoside hydrolase family 88 protein [Acidobacteriaceae bacterium]|nr:glycoside hydrolase family 88 protein [Acidobacteriaceae bacterium]
MNIRKVILSAALVVLFAFTCEPPILAQSAPWSERMANSTLARWPEDHFAPAGAPLRWNYELGTLLEGMDAVWYGSAKGDYYRSIKASVDSLVSPDGSIPTYDASGHQLDSILLGRQLLLLYNVTQDKRYYKAAMLLRQQLAQQPKNASGGFWHKTIYPNQMWLDGLYMAEPFYAEYAARFQEPQDFAEITRQFVLIDQHARDAKTGLLYHGWDESRQQDWANRQTGDSQSFWARGMGWYMMALVDTLPWYPENDPGRAELLAILRRTAAAVVKVQDPQSGLWYQVMDKPGAKGNYFEASAACMFTYALAKGVRLGYLPRNYTRNAERGWRGIQARFVKSESDGNLTLKGTVKVAGLGGTDHRDGSYAYYVAQPVVDNDPKGIGAFLLAASEMEKASHATAGLGQTVLLDAWFNSQTRTNAAGQTELFHYKWDDDSNSGFSFFGHIWRNYGVSTKTLPSAPTPENLKGAQYYIIVSPDNAAKNPNPHYMTADDVEQIARWVRAGGVLLMMENDPANADIDHLDLLADKLGLHFNNVLVHHVEGDNYAMGRIDLPIAAPPFMHPHVLYMKDTCSIKPSVNAVPLLRDKAGDLLMASAKYGKGLVFAVTDPWVYNEYTDGRKLPPEYDNFSGGVELVDWLLKQRVQLPH